MAGTTQWRSMTDIARIVKLARSSLDKKNYLSLDSVMLDLKGAPNQKIILEGGWILKFNQFVMGIETSHTEFGRVFLCPVRGCGASFLGKNTCRDHLKTEQDLTAELMSLKSKLLRITDKDSCVPCTSKEEIDDDALFLNGIVSTNDIKRIFKMIAKRRPTQIVSDPKKNPILFHGEIVRSVKSESFIDTQNKLIVQNVAQHKADTLRSQGKSLLIMCYPRPMEYYHIFSCNAAGCFNPANFHAPLGYSCQQHHKFSKR